MAVIFRSALIGAFMPIATFAAAVPQMRSELHHSMNTQAMSLEPGGQFIDQSQARKFRREAPEDCNVNFPQGVPKKSNCSKTHPLHTPIDKPWMCQMAAEEAQENSADPTKNNTNEHFFVTDQTEQSVRPRGCFIFEEFYYFNGMALWPTGDVLGTPICQEPKYDNATAADTCSDPNFAVIMSEATCNAAASCMNVCQEAHFRVVDPNQTDLYSTGCHFHPETGCVQFNPTEAPATPTGMQICNSTVHYAEANVE